MSQSELLVKVISALEEANVEYMLTGSFASSLQGEPRLTHDIDLVVAIKEVAVDKLVKAFSSEEYYLDEQSIVKAIKEKDMFNLIKVDEGDKVDFWLLTDEPFDQSRFNRRYTDEFIGMKIQISSPEDTILSKLKWAKMSGGSEKQINDAVRVYEVQFDNLDSQYLNNWVEKLSVKKEFNELVEKAKPI